MTCTSFTRTAPERWPPINHSPVLVGKQQGRPAEQATKATSPRTRSHPASMPRPAPDPDRSRSGPHAYDRRRRHSAQSLHRISTPRRAGAALPGERPRSGPERAQIGLLLSPPEPPRIRSRPRTRDQHRGNHQRQCTGGLNDGGAQTSPSKTTTTCRAQSREAPPRRARDPRRRPSTARASPCSFLRGGGVEGEGRGRLALGFREEPPVSPREDDAGVGGRSSNDDMNFQSVLAV
jgi:hypothetical protein